MRKQVIIGNWKMFKTNSEAIAFIKEVDAKIKKDDSIVAGLAVPFTALKDAKEAANNIVICAENVHWEENGAFTGEISIPMLKDLGIDHVLVGHSERREMFNETNETVNKKVTALLKNNMTPVLCCGEPLNIYEEGTTVEWVKTQVFDGLKGISAADAKKVIIAYEPIWAIGTGKVATPEIAQSVIKDIRTVLADMYDQGTADEIVIQYGGSVKPETISGLLSQADIDGALVGGASLDPASYLGLVNYKG